MRGAILAKAVAGLTVVLVAVAVLAGGAAAGISAILGGTGGSQGGSTGPPTSLSAIPPDYLVLYQAAATTCAGLSWTVLAAIGTIESDNGTSGAAGVASGANAAGAEGPMQFEPATFAVYDQPIPPGGADPPSPYDPVDAVYAAARDLCANGAANGRDLAGAIFNYNHAAWYVTEVLALAASYAGQSGTAPTGATASLAVNSGRSLPGTRDQWAATEASTAPGAPKAPTPWR